VGSRVRSHRLEADSGHAGKDRHLNGDACRHAARGREDLSGQLGVAISDDFLTVVDPARHTAANIKLPTRDDPKTIRPFFPQSMLGSSPYYGDEILWTNPANPHNPMMDGKGRVWLTHQIRAASPAM
jgi:hypothetical protein